MAGGIGLQPCLPPFRTIFGGLAFAGLMAVGYACSDTNGGSSRTSTGGDTSSGPARAARPARRERHDGERHDDERNDDGQHVERRRRRRDDHEHGIRRAAPRRRRPAWAAPASGTGGAGGSGSDMACGSNGQPYTGPLLGRCAPTSCTDEVRDASVGKGGFLTLDDFETAGFTAPVTDGAPSA